MSLSIPSQASSAPLTGPTRAPSPAMHIVRADLPAPDRSPVAHREAVVCSFHTPDEYYAGHARELAQQLESLGVRYELLEVQKTEGEDWADVTRRKIGFIHGVCQKHPDSMVVWIDVDCRITHLPDYVRDTTADFIGFQRSFRSPMQIGYANRTRFWEPSFWGVNATPLGRKLIDDAYALEQRSDLKATDDYFLEEAWRANAHNLTFQMISSTAIVREDKETGAEGRPPFFVFGSSGNVAEFKGKVVQHGSKKKVGARKKMLAQAKKIEASLPDDARQRLRRISDTVGITGALTADTVRVVDPVRMTCVGDMLSAGMTGDPIAFAAARKKFDNAYIVGPAEDASFEVSEAFLEYSARDSPISLRLAWWVKPFPGNFGDWLSPLAVASATSANILFQNVTDPPRSRTSWRWARSGGSSSRARSSSAPASPPPTSSWPRRRRTSRCAARSPPRCSARPAARPSRRSATRASRCRASYRWSGERPTGAWRSCATSPIARSRCSCPTMSTSSTSG